MQRFRLAWFSQLGAALRPLAAASVSDTPSTPSLNDVSIAKNFLEVLAHPASMPLSLRASQEARDSLLSALNQILQSPDPEQALSEHRPMLSYLASQVVALLIGELSVQNVYYVLPKRAYDINILIEDATKLFSPDIASCLTEIERYDIREAGRSLAFELPTAAAFHLFRVTESVLRRYYRFVTHSVPKQKMRNWGAYIKTLRKCGGDEKILSALEQIKDLHRNPIMHPESQISVEESFSLVGIVESVISTMIANITRQDIEKPRALLAAENSGADFDFPVSDDESS